MRTPFTTLLGAIGLNRTLVICLLLSCLLSNSFSFGQESNARDFDIIKVSTRSIDGLLSANSETSFNALQLPRIAKDSTGKDTLSRFDRFSKAGEKVFKYIPVPVFAYSSEKGILLGLAKFNLARFDKTDTISTSSTFSELVTFTTRKELKIVLSSTQYYSKNLFIINGQIIYLQFPELFFGVGNTAYAEDLEEVNTRRFEFSNSLMVALNKKRSLYAGIYQEFKNYFSVEVPENSFLIQNNYAGLEGGITSGLGVLTSYDTRINRNNPQGGEFLTGAYIVYGRYIGSDFNYVNLTLDLRKYFNPWKKHIIAIQAYTQINSGNVPFYDLSLLGGSTQMRGYFEGALRDKAMISSQIEYRMPVWKMFGLTGWLNAGRVAKDFSSLNFSELRYGGGIGLRVRVDSKNNTNMRFDFGFGERGAQTFTIGFSEAF